MCRMQLDESAYPRQMGQMTDKDLLILGIETSCDETAAAVVRLRSDGSAEVLAERVRSQIEEHTPYGGVVPEIAARAHIEILDRIVADGEQREAVGLELVGDLLQLHELRHTRRSPIRRPMEDHDPARVSQRSLHIDELAGLVRQHDRRHGNGRLWRDRPQLGRHGR